MKRIFTLFIALVSLFIFVSCDSSKTISFSEKEVTIEVGETFDFNIPEEVNYVLSSDGILEEKDGKVTGLKEGKTDVTITLKSDSEVTITVSVVVKTGVYKITYDLDGGTCENLKASYPSNETFTLPIPEKEGFIFAGWFDSDNLLTVVSGKDYNLKAKWLKEINFESDEITIEVNETYQFNKNDLEGISLMASDSTIVSVDNSELQIKGIKKGTCELLFVLENDKSEVKKIKVTVKSTMYKITYDLDGGTCDSLIYGFEKDQKVTLPIPEKEGFSFLGWLEKDVYVEEIENRDYELKASWESTEPFEIEIKSNIDNNVYYLDEEIHLTAIVHPASAVQDVKWTSLNINRATIDEDGKITILRSGEVSFRATSTVNKSVKTVLEISIKAYINPYKFIDSIQVKDPVAQKITAYSSDTGYKTYLLGGVTSYLFKDIEVTQNIIPEGRGNRPGTSSNGNQFSAKYVTVHDVGAAGNALSNTNYCTSPATETSWHFTVGDDGIYQQLPLNEVGFHAGDGTTVPLEFYNSGIKAIEGDDTPAKITINQLTGYFVINGQDTLVKAPLNGEGGIVNDSQLPYTGINNYVNEEGYYMISNTYWNRTYKVLSNRGGNLNSIGIETTVNSGSNIYRTWHYTAKLIANYIFPKTGLKPTDVKQHNTFSGKNCPQTMRRANRWESFMDMVNAEYLMRAYFSSGWTIEFISNSPYISSIGLISDLPETQSEETYSIRLSNGSDFDHTFEYTVVLPSKNTIVY